MVKTQVDVTLIENGKSLGGIVDFSFSVELLQRKNGFSWSLNVPKQDLDLILFDYDQENDEEITVKRKLTIHPFIDFNIKVHPDNVGLEGFFVERVEISVNSKEIHIYL